MKFIAIKGSDRIEVEITDEAVIKLDTGAISGPQHATVESIFATIARDAGGQTRRVIKPGAHNHLHAALKAHAGDGHSHSH